MVKPLRPNKANELSKTADIVSRQGDTRAKTRTVLNMTQSLKKQLKIFLPALMSVAFFGIVVFWFILPQIRSIIVKNKLETLRELTHAVHSLLTTYDLQVQAGVMKRSEAEAHAIDRIRLMRYGLDGNHYFWINDLNPRMIMHPFQPELIGQDMSLFADPRGKLLFQSFVQIARKHSEGHVQYHGQRKDDPSLIVPKLSYVKLFEPWNWILGTGMYMSDVHQEITRMRGRLMLVGGGVLVAVILVSGFMVIQGIAFEKERNRMERRLRRLASTDPLTGALNRRYFWQIAGMEIHRHQRYFRELAVLVMDIDHFKRINDTFGHPAGDTVLRELVDCCKKNLRKSDIFGRIGGEEFAIALVETKAEAAAEVADRLRRRLADEQILVEGGIPIKFTVSIGMTNARREDDCLDDLIKRADTAMYLAKKRGRNRVESADPLNNGEPLAQAH
jgi:diguanylate cyclase (GGDEF)-like protein